MERRHVTRLLMGAAAAAVLAAAACGGGSGRAAPDTQAEPAAARAIAAAPVVVIGEADAQAVTDAFLAFFSAYSEALFAGDVAPLEGHASAPVRDAVAAEIARRRAEGSALMLTAMQHRPMITEAGQGRAVVEGVAQLDGTPVKPGTQDPVGAPVTEEIRYRVELTREGDRWVVSGFTKTELG